MEKEQFCEKLSGETCTVIQEKCFRMEERKPCEYVKTYLPLLIDIRADTPPIARKVSETMLEPFLDSWTRHARNPKAGAKRVIATPLEKEMRKILKLELSSLDVDVSDTAKELSLWEGCSINVDCLAKKLDYPISIFSFKTWIGKGQVRETFASDYWAKTWLGQKHVRAYQIGILKTPTKAKTIERLIEICKPYIDGVFFLTEVPYVDDLIKGLKELYSGSVGNKQ